MADVEISGQRVFQGFPGMAEIHHKRPCLDDLAEVVLAHNTNGPTNSCTPNHSPLLMPSTMEESSEHILERKSNWWCPKAVHYTLGYSLL